MEECITVKHDRLPTGSATDTLATVVRLSANSRPIFRAKPVGRLSADSRPTVGRQTTNNRPTVGRQL